MSDSNEQIIIEINLPYEEEGEVVETGIGERLGNLLRVKPKEFGKIVKVIPIVANNVHQHIKDIEPLPSKVTLELGFSMRADGSLYVVGVSSSSTFKVQLSWDNPPPS